MYKSLIESMVQEYKECQENFKILDKAHDVLFKEWESEYEKGLCNEELGKKLDEAYEKLETARSDRNIKAVACLDILLEKGII